WLTTAPTLRATRHRCAPTARGPSGDTLPFFVPPCAPRPIGGGLSTAREPSLADPDRAECLFSALPRPSSRRRREPRSACRPIWRSTRCLCDPRAKVHNHGSLSLLGVKSGAVGREAGYANRPAAGSAHDGASTTGWVPTDRGAAAKAIASPQPPPRFCPLVP